MARSFLPQPTNLFRSDFSFRPWCIGSRAQASFSFSFFLVLFFQFCKTVFCYRSSINSLRGSTVQCWAALPGIYHEFCGRGGSDAPISPIKKKKKLKRCLQSQSCSRQAEEYKTQIRLFIMWYYPFPNNSIRPQCHKVLCGFLTSLANVIALRAPSDCGNEVNDEFHL